MSRNRIRNSQSLHWMAVLKWILMAALLSALALSYILYKNQIVRIAEETRQQERELDRINERNKQLLLDIARLQAPQELQRRVEGRQLVRLTELELVRFDHGALPSYARAYNSQEGQP
jgi:hypothetical protein